MTQLSTITGQVRVQAQLRQALAQRKVHHAMLFDGPDGVGKAHAARAFAMALNCERGAEAEGCGECASCQKIVSGTHPDVIWFDMTPKGLTDRVRDLLAILGFAPHEGATRIVVIDPAHQLAGQVDDAGKQSAQAANALLKSLEEPPARTHFILVTSQPARLPLTVRSRCQRVRFSSLDDGAMAARGEGPDAEARVERARALVEAAKTARKNTRAVFETAQQVGGDRDEAIASLLVLTTWLRDALVESVGADAALAPARRNEAREVLGTRAPSALISALRETEQAGVQIKQFIAPQLVLEQLMMGALST